MQSLTDVIGQYPSGPLGYLSNAEETHNDYVEYTLESAQTIKEINYSRYYNATFQMPLPITWTLYNENGDIVKEVTTSHGTFVSFDDV